MRIFLIRVSIITGIVLVLLLTILAGMAQFAPLHPGNVLFPIQYISEQQSRRIYTDPTQRGVYMLNLLERRINDLKLRTGTRHELAAMQYLEKSLDQAIYEINSIPQDENAELQLRLLELITECEEVLLGLTYAPKSHQNYFEEFLTKIKAFIQMVQTGQEVNVEYDSTLSPVTSTGDSQTATSPLSPVPGGLVPFPPGSAGARHEFYPLIGMHAVLSCEGCHKQGKYSNTPNACINCHFSVRPIPHYYGRCDLCHSANNWLEIHFDHANINVDYCSSCHQNDEPANHYNGQCSACHITQAWNIVTFNHAAAGATDCQACHMEARPVNHYNGQCSACHITQAWNIVTFNHAAAGATDCQACHMEVRPVNHYAGQCSNCHNTGSWANVSFNHAGFTDCVSCHSADRPANHFSGQCTNCHNTDTSWKNAFFNHSGNTDCIACHAGIAPAGHFQGQCSVCHSTDTWKGAIINHANLTECTSCHLKDQPDKHEPGDCAQCHSYPRWKD